MRSGEAPAPSGGPRREAVVTDDARFVAGGEQCFGEECGSRDEVPYATTDKGMTWTTRAAPSRVGSSADI